MTQSDKVRRYDEARRRFATAAQELVHANKRACAAGQRDSMEMHEAVKRLDDAQKNLQRTEDDLDRKFEPVGLTPLLERKVDDTFAPQDRRAAIDLLINECGRNLPLKNDAEPKHLEQIRLAVLKLADGNLEELRRHIQTAKSDWRDVIVFAESPEFMRSDIGEFYQLDHQSRAAIQERDRQQYFDWLNSKPTKR